MQTANTKPDKVTSTIETIGAGVFLCVPVLWAFGMMAKDHPVPAEVQGCYKNGQQTLQVQGTRIIVNGNPAPEVNVRYMNTNVGRQIETVNGSWLELDQDQPPHKQVGRNMIIRVQDNALVALTRDAEAIPFARGNGFGDMPRCPQSAPPGLKAAFPLPTQTRTFPKPDLFWDS